MTVFKIVDTDEMIECGGAGTREAAKRIVKEYEWLDKRSGDYKENRYEIVEEV